MINRRNILKTIIGSIIGTGLVTEAVKAQVLDRSVVHNPISNDKLPRKVMHFPSYFRNGGTIGNEDFITEIHIGGPIVRMTNVNFINTEIHTSPNNKRCYIENCSFNNLPDERMGLYV